MTVDQHVLALVTIEKGAALYTSDITIERSFRYEQGVHVMMSSREVDLKTVK